MNIFNTGKLVTCNAITYITELWLGQARLGYGPNQVDFKIPRKTLENGLLRAFGAVAAFRAVAAFNAVADFMAVEYLRAVGSFRVVF